MSNTSKYQLFVSNKCSCCDKIVDYLKRKKISISTINIDKEDYTLPFSLMIFPALVKEKKVVSYGCDDIIIRLNIA
ncbi:MAG: hypothetical protein COA97_02545 [Flavobacteriales bacterium]|nr:MAG: hypothetical protein COA97_02545 [Flavobacteriales bacterium]